MVLSPNGYLPGRFAIAWSRALKPECRSPASAACSTASICRAVSPDAPARVIASATATLYGERTRLPSSRARALYRSAEKASRAVAAAFAAAASAAARGASERISLASAFAPQAETTTARTRNGASTRWVIRREDVRARLSVPAWRNSASDRRSGRFRIEHAAHEQDRAGLVVADEEQERAIDGEVDPFGGAARRAADDGGRRRGLGPLLVDGDEALVHDVLDQQRLARAHLREVSLLGERDRHP